MNLNENEAFVTAYLTDEEIEQYGNIPGAMLAAMRADEEAAARFAYSYVIGSNLIPLNLPEPPDTECVTGDEPAWLRQ